MSLRILAGVLGVFYFFAAEICFGREAIYPGREAELAREAALYEGCLEALYEPDEERVCAEWLAVFTCAMADGEHRAKVLSRISEENFQKYRVAARYQLPVYCDPMAAILLDLEILEGDVEFDSAFRRQVWQGILEKARDRSEDERLIVAREALSSSEADVLLKMPAWQSFFEKTRDDCVLYLPEIPENASKFLHALEMEAPKLAQDSRTQAWIMVDELERGAYVSARERFSRVDVRLLDDRTRTLWVKRIFTFSGAIFEKQPLLELGCYGDFAAVKPLSAAALARLDILESPKSPAAVTVLYYEASQRFPRCDYEHVLKMFARIWSSQGGEGEAAGFGDELMSMLALSPDLSMIRAIVESMDAMDPKGRANFIRRYGARFFDTALAAFLGDDQELPELERMLGVLENGSYGIFVKRQRGQVLLRLGYLRAARKDCGGAARDFQQVVDDADMPSLMRSKAYYLAVRNARACGRDLQARALYARFKEEFPGSVWQAMLSE